MRLRLPPRYFNVPRLARFRAHRLPRELYFTWETIYALGWVNRYEFTPPLLTRELAALCGLEERAFQAHVQKLRAWGWFAQIDNTRNGNVYRPHVPDDTPESCGELTSDAGSAASDFESAPNGTDFSGHADTTVEDVLGAEGCSKMHPSRAITAVAAVLDLGAHSKEIPTAAAVITRTREDEFRIRDALDDLGLVDDEAQAELLGLPHVTPEFVEDWVCSHLLDGNGRGGNSNLGPGYYRLQIRQGRRSRFEMSPKRRREYRAQKDLEWEKDVTDARMGANA